MAEEAEQDGTAAEGIGPGAHTDARYGVPVTRSRGQLVLHPDREQVLETVAQLRGDGFVMLLDVTAVDYLANPVRDLPEGVVPERFEVVIGLISHRGRERVRLRVQVPEGDPTMPSLFDLHPGAEALEREAYDMFGIVFEGNPDMSRILMPDDWDGYPLRKDFDVGRIPVQFKGAPGPR